jgi:hypothetical protein
MAQSRRNKLGKQLLGFALDGFYYFEDDQIEDALEEALDKYETLPNWRKCVRVWIWSHEHLRRKICDIAQEIYGKISP